MIQSITTQAIAEASIGCIVAAVEDKIAIQDEFSYCAKYDAAQNILVYLTHVVGQKDAEPYDYNRAPSAPEYIYDNMVLSFRMGVHPRDFTERIINALEKISNIQID